MQYDVCIITTIHKDFDNRIFFRQLESLVESGQKVCIVAPWDFSNRERNNYCFVDTTPYPVSRFARLNHAYKTYVEAKQVNAKVYIFHDPDFLLFGLLLKKLKKHVVFDCHENIPEDILYGKPWIPKYLRKSISYLYKFFENFIIKRLDNVICVVPYQVKRFSTIADNVIMIRNFSKLTTQNQYAASKSVLYIGSISEDYGSYLILDIAREIKTRKSNININIVDYFGHNDKLRKEFLSAIRLESLNINILDRVPSSLMGEILSQGCIGISPMLNTSNKKIAYPTKIFEYFSYNLAVIASDVGYTRHILKDGQLGVLITENDIVQWVDAIENLISDEKLRHQYTVKARTALSEDYSWDLEKKELIKYVSALIKR